MAIFSQTESTERLIGILESEHRALLGGRFDVLQRLMPAKEQCIAALRQTGDISAVLELRQQLERNQSLLQAAAKGINSARKALQQAGRQPAALVTYDRAGKRGEVVPERVSPGRKA